VSTYLIAALLVPHFLNQVDSLAGKLIVLRKAWKRRKRSK
jgi:hypothetical protein